MHGFQGYPTEAKDNQISRINLLRRQFPNSLMGFADHSPENADERLWLSAVAVGAGVTVLEKHLTSALVCRDEDYESALNPDSFAEYAVNMRLAAAAFGQVSAHDDFGMSVQELDYRNKMKKHIIARRDLSAGEHIIDDDIDLKRTSSEGELLRNPENAIGRMVINKILAGNAILNSDLK